MAPDYTIAVDIGGTFTDLVAHDGRSGTFEHAKSLTTPQALVDGIMDCIAKSGSTPAEATEVVHGSTIAINTLLEAKGARAALVVTRGTRDVYRIGRGNRPQAYDLFFRRPTPLVDRALTFEVTERMLSSGAIDVPLDEDSVIEVCEQLRGLDVEAIAICLLHAYVNPEHEQRVGAIVRRELPDVYVSLSHEILREYREYERTSTTVVNSYVGPVVSRYVDALGDRLADRGFRGSLWIMQSNGGVMAPGTAAHKPVAMMESGPVGGIIAAAEVGQQLGFADVISFDMGGTTAKASLVRDGTPTVADGYYVGGYAEGHPVLSPVVDVVEVGTGGGSIAWVDEVGQLNVGPRSAGAEPGPICYGRGGVQPTITDANVALGRIRAGSFLGGEMALDADGARAGIEEHVARPLGLDVVAAAHGILEIANAKMSLAVREVSVAKGYDPRDFALVASGGAGPLHAVAIARELHLPSVIVPRFPGHFSAVGMLVSDQKHDQVQTIYVRLDRADPAELAQIYRDMVDRTRAVMDGRSAGVRFDAFLDMRYAGQEFTLPVPTTAEELERGDLEVVRRHFDEIHLRRFGHQAPDEKVELVNLRVRGVGTRAKPSFQAPAAGSTHIEPADQVAIHLDAGGDAVRVPVYVREGIPAGARIDGPALIEEQASTTILFEGDHCEVAPSLELLVGVGSDA